jgi:hypothetical protein
MLVVRNFAGSPDELQRVFAHFTAKNVVMTITVHTSNKLLSQEHCKLSTPALLRLDKDTSYIKK